MGHACKRESTALIPMPTPVALWDSIRLLLTLTAIHAWHTKQIDYVLALFPRVPVEKELYMAIPKGFKTSKGCTDDYAL
jgi:hypothetical protein